MAEFATNGKANTALTLGSVALGLSALGSNVGNILGIGKSTCESDHYVTRYESDKDATIASLEQKIAIGEAEKYSDQKLADIYERLAGRILGVERQVSDNAASQGVINATMGASVSVLQSQMAQISGLTKLVIPNTNVCPGWGEVTITPKAN